MVTWVFTRICIYKKELRKSTDCIVARGVFVFLFVKPFLYLFFRCSAVCIIHLNVNAARRDLFHMSEVKETQNGLLAISLYLISIQHAWNTLPSLILPFGLVFKL